ncbi:VacJ family lipoprotein [uncultured Tateyamaria sp.]|uniref:MlaA family lipoprotein n=1 Tax=uncultured Tateyamaria sp. TaxID=455651 RepID=UPI002602998A|nr:VacJ family lipoprotein [uncultured Tateyamaria sp.]
MSLYYRVRRASVLLLAVGSLAACATTEPRSLQPEGINDPYEAQNRRVHEFNRGLDRAIVRPAAVGYSTVLPDEIEDSISNFARNLGEPSVTVNSLLQGDLRGAGISSVRFVTNSVLGIFGLFDVASDFDVPRHDTDFGETLFVWGVGEGAYVELPVLGPSTARRTTGIVVDLFTNPLSYFVDSPEQYYGTLAAAASGLSRRGRFSDTVDSILYESADSYAQARLIWLQNRRFELGDGGTGSEIDPFALDTEGF